MKQVTTATVVAYCIPDFAKGIFGVMVSNYLLYFYQPSVESGIPTLITQGIIFFGVLTLIGFVKAIGHVIDAFSDPLIANMSDKCKSRLGRRIPFLRWSAIPYAACTFLIFCAPTSRPSLLNNIWISLFIWFYYLSYTFYMIPHTALLPEMVTDAKARVNAYTINSFMFVTGSAFGYMTPLFVSFAKNAGLPPVQAWRTVFFIYTLVGLVLLLIPAFAIKETEYVRSVRPTQPLWPSLKRTFRNRHFRLITCGQLLEGTSMAFFQSCIMYYVVTLLGLPETASVVILGVSIAGSLLMYPLISHLARKYGKRSLMLWGCAVFTVAQFIIFLFADYPVSPWIKGIGLALFVSFPFAVLNILPGALMADIIQYDTIQTGVNQEGVFSAARSFITKMGQSLAMMIVPSLLIIGAVAGENVGRMGLKVTALVSGVFCIGSIVCFAMYNEKEVFSVIRSHETQGGAR